MTKDKDKKEKNEEVPEVDLPVAVICTHLRNREGSVGEDLRFVRYITANDPRAIRYFMGEFSVPILRYMTYHILHLKNDSEYGEPYQQVAGDYYLFIASPFNPPDDPKPVAYCDICGSPIYEGDGITDINGDKWCDECLAERRTIA